MNGGVLGMVRTLATELAPIRVNGIHPGVIGDSPYGALGDCLLVPDPSAHVHVDFQDGTPPEDFMLGDIVTMQGVFQTPKSTDKA